MKIIGLTGSIATGKSTVASWISQLGIPIHDADAVVHQLLSAGGEAVQPILDFFGPNAGSVETGINRKVIGDLVFATPDCRQHLEAILHPMVRRLRSKFLSDHRKTQTPIVVLDVPLLFETGGDADCDYVIVVHARQETLTSRALSRPGMTMGKLTGILASQMPMEEKMRRANLCLDTDLAPADTKKHLEAWLENLKDADALIRLSRQKRRAWMMREIVLDTETTGLSPRDGHRIIEIGALELLHHLPTGRQLHIYINPECEIDAGAVAVHGLTNEFLADKPVFADVADEFLEFVDGDPLVIHNAPFDIGFINAELDRLQRTLIPMSQSIDTLIMARKKFPGAQANLDALCRRFEIDNSHRGLHGAMVDADLLALVYIELLGGRQPGLLLETPVVHETAVSTANDPGINSAIDSKILRPVRKHVPTSEELAAHEAFLKSLTNPIWTRDDPTD